MQASVRSILELHNETLEDFLSLREFQKLQNDLLVGAEHASLRNEVAKEGSDLSGGTRDCNSNGG